MARQRHPDDDDRDDVGEDLFPVDAGVRGARHPRGIDEIPVLGVSTSPRTRRDMPSMRDRRSRMPVPPDRAEPDAESSSSTVMPGSRWTTSTNRMRQRVDEPTVVAGDRSDAPR